MTKSSLGNKSKEKTLFTIPMSKMAFTKKMLKHLDARGRKKCQLLLVVLGVFAIMMFAFFLRYEDFSTWQQEKAFFQYKGEYQMANFDSYYSLQVAKDLQNGDYDGVDEKRRVPDGMARPALPPMLPLLTVGVHKLTGIQVPSIAIFMPVCLSLLLVPLVFMVARGLHLNNVTALTASLFSVVSLTYVIRTRIGVFDTDSLNVFFPLLNSYLFFRFAEIETSKRYTYLALGGVNTFLYFLWWQTAGGVVILSAVVPLSVALVFFYKIEKVVLKYGALSALILVSLYFFSDEMLSSFKLLFNQTNDAYFPPENMSVTELDPVSLKKFIKGTVGNKFLFGISLFGLGLLVWKHTLKALFFTIPVLIAILPFFAGNRFMIFSAPVLALGAGCSAQLLFDLKTKIKPSIAYVATAFLVALGIGSNYRAITDKVTEPAPSRNIPLLNALQKNTTEKSSIWTNWELGYQVHYYLDRGTFADGEFSDGELYFYLSYPLATAKLSVAANFIRFYHEHGIEGMQTLYELFPSEAYTFSFLEKVLSLTPMQAAQWLTKKRSLLPKTEKFATPKQWILFLFPKQAKDIYLLLHYRMSQTAFWFKQGNSDLKTGKTKGLPLFLAFRNLKEQNGIIQNNEIAISLQNGIGKHTTGAKHFQHILTYDGVQPETKTYPRQAIDNGKRDERFVFQWNKQVGFGAAMSQEMANTTFVKLYLQQQNSPYFEPVSLNTPHYQLWKVKGNVY